MNKELERQIDAHWALHMVESPESATRVGFPGQDHRWTDLSPDAVMRRKQASRDQLAALNAIDAAGLDPNDRLNYQLFRQMLEHAVEGACYPAEFLRLDPMWGPQSWVAKTIELMPAVTGSEVDNILARLEAIPHFIDESIALMEQGLAIGVTPPKIVLRDQGKDETSHLTLTKAIRDGSAAREAARIVETQVLPSFRTFNRFVVDSYVPRCRETTSWSGLPDGDAWYSWLVRYFTTTDMTPTQIHAVGLSEVERIRAKMQDVIKSSGFSGSFDEFCEFLRTDPQFYFDDADDLLVAYRDISKRADPELPRLFGVLPRLPYGVVPVPSYIEKTTTTAYYQRGSPGAGRPGYFFANTYDLKSRPKWEMEALTLHEAVPGHHLQLALSQEMTDAPEFRKNSVLTAYIEGWGLYAESLGEQMGFYQDAYSKFGQLTYEMWRAVRLVVDTGMHALGWSRERAIDFFKANSSKPEHDIRVEVDRYICWPGQALAYKIGELKIKELRALAEVKLGDAFDIRSFHDELLGAGALPLDILSERMTVWLKSQFSPNVAADR